MIVRSTVSRWEILKFVARNVPMVLWAGVRVKKLTHSVCVTSLKRNWRNRNPYNGTYFAAILTGAEMASGLMVFDELRVVKSVSGRDLVARIVNVRADFKRQITCYADFTCIDGKLIEQAVINAAATPSRRGENVETRVSVTNEYGKNAANIYITWNISPP